jgi:hypothetical protein
MTDTTIIAPLRLRSPDQFLTLARRCARALVMMVESSAEAAEMAYVWPFQQAKGRVAPFCPDSEAGRDPNW